MKSHLNLNFQDFFALVVFLVSAFLVMNGINHMVAFTNGMVIAFYFSKRLDNPKK